MRALGKRLVALLTIVLAASAHAQKTYECRDSVAGSIYQRYDPCPAGTDIRRTPEQQNTQQDLHRQNTQNDYASMRGEVRTGMTPAQVQRAWGNPHRVIADTTDSTVSERWVYACPVQRGMPIVTTRIYFQKGVVTKIHKAC